jgi:hypothetical protein
MITFGHFRIFGSTRVELVHVGQRHDLVDRTFAASLDQFHHRLVVRDADIVEAPEAGAGVRQEVEQVPAGRPAQAPSMLVETPRNLTAAPIVSNLVILL